MPVHWTLLTVRFSADGTFLSAAYKDSLEKERPQTRNIDQCFLWIYSLTTQLPKRTDTSHQRLPECGFWVLSWIEEEWLSFLGHGPAARPHPQTHILQLRKHLQTVTAALAAERQKLIEDAKKSAELAAKKVVSEKAKKEQEKQLAAQKKANDEAAELAKKLLDAGHKLRVEDLPESKQHQLWLLSLMKSKGCHKCRWSEGGCLVCEYQHCLAHAIKQQMPAWLEAKRAELPSIDLD